MLLFHIIDCLFDVKKLQANTRIVRRPSSTNASYCELFLGLEHTLCFKGVIELLKYESFITSE